MKKRILSIVLCLVIAAGCVFVPTTVSAADGEKITATSGALIKNGDYLYSTVLKDLDKGSVVRTKSDGTEAKEVAKISKIVSEKLYSYKTKIYFQDKNKIKVYNTNTEKVSTLKTLKYGEKSPTKVSLLVKTRGICSKGLIVEYLYKGTYLLSFKGKLKKMVDGKENKLLSYKEFVTATDKYVFFHISEKKEKNVYTDRLYRYSLEKGTVKKMGTFKSSKITDTPAVSDSYVFKNKILFITIAFQKEKILDGDMYSQIGMVYSMDKNGSNLKLVKSGVNIKFFTGKDCVYIQNCSSEKYALYKINTKGEISTVIKPNPMTDNKSYVFGCTTTGYSLNVKLAKNSLSYDVYRNAEPTQKTGTLVMKGKNVAGTDNALAYPHIYGSYKDMMMVSYFYADLSDESSLLDSSASMKFKTYLVNAKTGEFKRIA